MRTNRVWWIPLLSLALLASSCVGSVTPIRKLLDDPGSFDQRSVSIAGDVVEAVSVLGYGAYKVDDGTGSILVLSKQTGAPRQGAKVGVTGEFRQAFTYGAVTGAVLLERQRAVR